ncbi:uncharacterized protein CLUP02_08959 [Colletotrichum lupini]|uniref:Uncharacterized protein n=1 Tax=Colletotrichum lupini TaxID=145971 RepID=A0A9Q8STV1_9PEZI|nr:uncharacterized protein CLUP02_08959 [Colletotrichum lupini]UQC83464.1 hypothetical protein CLUP02_08959 [Colletotrichum lupini]
MLWVAYYDTITLYRWGAARRHRGLTRWAPFRPPRKGLAVRQQLIVPTSLIFYPSSALIGQDEIVAEPLQYHSHQCHAGSLIGDVLGTAARLCNGGRPCSNCVVRGLKCASTGPSAGFQFVQQQASSVPRALVQDSWKYISTYFQSVGCLTQASVMRSADVTALSHRDENVSRMLSIMGGLYACQNPQVLRVSQKERKTLLGTWVKQKALMAAELKKPDPSSFSSVLLSTLLLAVIEVLLCAEDGAFQKWLQRISSFIAQHLEAKSYAGLTTFERSLIRFSNFLNTLSAIALNEEPLDRQMDFELSSSRPIAPRTISDEDEIDDAQKAWYRGTHYLRMVEWALKLEKSTMTLQFDKDSYREAIDLKVQGLDIICEASALQARVINDLLRLCRIGSLIRPRHTADCAGAN